MMTSMIDRFFDFVKYTFDLNLLSCAKLTDGVPFDVKHNECQRS